MIKNTERITYQLIEHDIHRFSINNSDRQTIDDLFEKLTEILQSGLFNERSLYLFDTEAVTELPIRYLIQRAEKWEKEQPFIPPAKTALLYNLNGLMIFAVNMLIKIFNKHNGETRVFAPNQRDEALEWLRSND